ncbi:protein MpNBS-LRR13 [Marchantia polymorpha subsp. ruderalis]
MDIKRFSQGSMAAGLDPARVSGSSDSLCPVRCFYQDISRAWKIRPLPHSRKFDA